jgi:hypothetical protein
MYPDFAPALDRRTTGRSRLTVPTRFPGPILTIFTIREHTRQVRSVDFAKRVPHLRAVSRRKSFEGNTLQSMVAVPYGLGPADLLLSLPNSPEFGFLR